MAETSTLLTYYYYYTITIILLYSHGLFIDVVLVITAKRVGLVEWVQWQTIILHIVVQPVLTLR